MPGRRANTPARSAGFTALSRTPRDRIDICHPTLLQVVSPAVKVVIDLAFWSNPDRVRDGSLAQRCRDRLARPVLFSVILTLIAQTYGRLCLGWVFPVSLHARHRLDISPTTMRHGSAVAVPAPTARPHGYLEPSPRTFREPPCPPRPAMRPAPGKFWKHFLQASPSVRST
jgi:hypothetical protein